MSKFISERHKPQAKQAKETSVCKRIVEKIKHIRAWLLGTEEREDHWNAILQFSADKISKREAETLRIRIAQYLPIGCSVIEEPLPKGTLNGYVGILKVFDAEQPIYQVHLSKQEAFVEKIAHDCELIFPDMCHSLSLLNNNNLHS
jgi:hypothetical protein